MATAGGGGLTLNRACWRCDGGGIAGCCGTTGAGRGGGVGSGKEGGSGGTGAGVGNGADKIELSISDVR